MPKISEKYKTLDNSKADTLSPTIVDGTYAGNTTFYGAFTTGNLHVQDRKAVIFYEDDANGTNYLAFRAPAAVTTSRYFNFPDGYPAMSTGYFLTSDTLGNLSWGQVAAGGTAFSAF